MVKGKKKKVHRLLSAVAAAMIALAGISNAQVSAGNNKADALTAEETAKLADVSKTAVLQEDGSYKINLSVTGRELEKESLLKRKEIMNTDVILLIDVSRSMTEYVQLNIPGVPNERRWTILQRVLGSKDEGLVYDILSGAVQDDGTVKESGNKVRFVFFGGSKDQTVIDYKVVDNNGQGYTINEIEQAVSTYAADVETTATSLLGSMRQITNTADGIRGAVKAVESARAAEPGRNTRVILLTDGDPTFGYGLVTTTKVRSENKPDDRYWSKSTPQTFVDADGNTKTSYEWTIMEIDPSQSVNTKIGFAYGYLEDRDNLDYKIAFSSFLSVESAMYEMAKLSAITQVDTIDMSKSALASQVFLERMKAEGLTKENYPADSVDGLKEAFNKIVGIKNASDYFRASSAVVEDKLSDYVDFKSGDVDFTLSVDGAEPVKLEKSGQTYTTGNHSVTVDGKVIRWNLENGAALDKDKKYTLSFSVKTNANAAALTEDKIATIISAEADKAYEDAKTNGTAGIEQATASVDTGTFTDKYGYYSNAYANLEYKAASIEGTGFTSAATAAAIAFPMPVVRALKETPKPVTEPEKTATPPAVVKEDKTKDSSSSTTTSDSSTTKTEKEEDVDVSNDSTPESSTNVKNDSTEEGIDIDGDGIPEGSASIKDEESLNVSGGSTPQGGAMLAATGGNMVLLFPALVVLIALIAGVGLIFVIERKSGKNKN